MPELPDITVYVERLRAMHGQRVLRQVELLSPFVLRTVEPPIAVVRNSRLVSVTNLGKRLVLGMATTDDPKMATVFLVIHLMIAGRLRWQPAPQPDSQQRSTVKLPPRTIIARLHFEHGILIFSEASKKKRASLMVIGGADAEQARANLKALDRGGLNLFDILEGEFRERLRWRNHTLKRALTDPTLFSGIGNAFSDEILFAACLSPVRLTQKLGDDECGALYRACRAVLELWTERRRQEVGDGFPSKVTAFHPHMQVHGKFRQPCPVCDAPIQRIRYADNETNYCPQCQNAGRLLADRSLSRLLKKDWPRSLADLEELKEIHRGGNQA